ncbi:MAG TPA: hypothetical protein VLF94_02635 [Chlamydiales bacterium]|nr:hypothetical protein [Chlamydiales bacterium]
MKFRWLIVSGVCLAGCVSNTGLQTDAVSETNRYRLSRVRKGMYEAQVLSVMRQPYNYETFQIGEDVYDVWFYVTNPTVLGQSRMVAQNLTPLSFKNGILVGTGYDYYYFITREMAKQRAAEAPPKEVIPPVQPRAPKPTTAAPSKAEPEVENKGLEKSLQKAVEPTPTQGPNPGNLQPSPQPTAPIISNAEPPAKRRRLFPLGAKQPISQVRKGMSEDEVQGIMGAPVDTQTFELGEDIYNVWFYGSGKKRTPLTFKNGKLAGMTNDYYNGIKQAASHDQIEGYDKKGERMQQDETEQDFDYW